MDGIKKFQEITLKIIEQYPKNTNISELEDLENSTSNPELRSFLSIFILFLKAVYTPHKSITSEWYIKGTDAMMNIIKTIQNVANGEDLIPLLASVYLLRGAFFFNLGEVKKAINDYNYVLETLKKHKIYRHFFKHLFHDEITKTDIESIDNNRWGWWLLVSTYILKGNAYNRIFDYASAYNSYCTAARMVKEQNEIRKKGGDHTYDKLLISWGIVLCYVQKGKLLIDQGKFVEAIKWFLVALRDMVILEFLDLSGTIKNIKSLVKKVDETIRFIDYEKNKKIIDKMALRNKFLKSTGIIPHNFLLNYSGKNPYDRHKSDIFNRLGYCLYILRPKDSGVDHILRWFDSAIKLTKTDEIDRRNILSHHNKIICKGEPDQSTTDLLEGNYKIYVSDFPRLLALYTLFHLPANKNKATRLLKGLLTNIANILTIPEKFYSIITKPRKIESENVNRLVILRRWSSFTPLVPRSKSTEALGGGYFLIWKGKGIAIDPGIDFVQNLYYAGFSLEDIDAIITTHAHIDHTNDLNALLTLIWEKERHRREIANLAGESSYTPQKVDLFFNIGSVHKYLPWILPQLEDKGSVIGSIYGLTVRGEEDFKIDIKKKYSMNIEVVKSEHHELISSSYAVGLKFHLLKEGVKKLTIGLTSDCAYSGGNEEEVTKYLVRIADKYKGCDVLILHVGDINFKELICETGEEFKGKGYKSLANVVENILGNADEKMRLMELIKPLGSEISPEDILESIFDKSRKASSSNHLGFRGISEIIEGCRKNNLQHAQLFVISEFPEYLGSFRHHVARVFDSKDSRCLTGDINMQIGLCIEGKYKVTIQCMKCAEDNNRNLKDTFYKPSSI
ncbi:MAG: MBL fold metallo-hydrolase, partial [Deltaproteobacteria bacterium]|nr:MBL fold metallo-hydrolase [Deltaproteobacteria bacterium]